MTDEPQTTAVAKPETKPPLAMGGQLAGIAPQSIEEAFRLSQALARAGDMVPKNFQGQPDQIMAAIIGGAEVGLMPMQALRNIAVINGRATLWGDALPALMQRAGHHIDVKVTGDGDAMVATATLTRGDTGKEVVREFSVADAKKANLWGKAGPWQQYPKRMLSMRARAWAVRDGAADAMMGLQVAEEVSDYGPDTARDVTPRASSRMQEMVAKARGRDVQLAAEPEDVSQSPAVEPEDVSQDAPEAAPRQPDPFSAAYEAGRAAFKAGDPADVCDLTGDDRADWLAGYQFQAKEG